MKNISILFLLLYFFSSCDFFKSADELYSEAEKMRNENKPKVAIELFEKMSISPDCKEFLTLPAYEEIISLNK